jgi:cyclohexyl-isocyanide hydratase
MYKQVTTTSSGSAEDSDSPPPFTIGIPLFEDVDALDVTGAHQVFFMLGSYNVATYLIGPKKGIPVTTLENMHIVPDYGYDDHPALDLVYVPGGYGDGFTRLYSTNKGPFYDFLKKACDSAKYICSVCTGALLLAQGGYLDGYNCTTHWAFKPALELFPNVLVAADWPRYVIDRNRITGAGISSTIDTAFAISAILVGEEVARETQLRIQYAPDPPYRSGDPSQAGPVTMQSVSNSIGTTEAYDVIRKSLQREGRISG